MVPTGEFEGHANSLHAPGGPLPGQDTTGLTSEQFDELVDRVEERIVWDYGRGRPRELTLHQAVKAVVMYFRTNITQGGLFTRRGALVDWVRPTTRRGRQLYGIESDVSPIRLLRQGGDTSQPASGARSRRIGGVRARSAIRHTARYEGASGLSIPGSGPEYPARGRRAEHATRRSDGAAHCAPPTAVTRCRRGPPARQACRADPTPSAAGSGPKCASLCH